MIPRSSPVLSLKGRSVGPDHPCYVIAEIGVNHNGDAQIAHQMIDAAKQAGADAVKFQSFCTEDLIGADTRKADYQVAQTGGGSQADMLRALELDQDTFRSLRRHCETVGIDFMSTAFDARSLALVVNLDPVCLKWPSGEITNVPLMRQAAQSDLPILLSTGMGGLAEIATAIDTLTQPKQRDIAILQCVSNYPARIEDQNLRSLPALSAAFGRPVGFSDHTVGPYAALVARGLGMCVLEKHFTLDRSQPGPDHAASIEPEDFASLITLLRQIEQGLGDGVKREIGSVSDVKAVAQKSLVFGLDLPGGHRLSEADLSAMRPGLGLSPTLLDLFVGRTLRQDVTAGTLVDFAHVE
ncbi:N,N'-diacetyllegionaminic acid synthase [Roseobacter cerasinus]|uniref:N,N'-diacetyllegionaminic acid synthase n=1 Tax=Roseobacter cerasinus TaxID=2602289 RepID=A0A640VTB2_9RHOB|nr:N-acetylneuraminate synthase family protein [Roseobacter cerasinus]GFE51057.1 N,N'-diacetyllegionaminic acid synthase [Roseobacter cerasinus]